MYVWYSSMGLVIRHARRAQAVDYAVDYDGVGWTRSTQAGEK